MSAIAIIGCVVGVVSCVVGVSSFITAQVTKAKQDGVLIAKIDQCVEGIHEIKKDIKEKNRELDKTLAQHSRDIVELKTKVEILEGKVGIE